MRLWVTDVSYCNLDTSVDQNNIIQLFVVSSSVSIHACLNIVVMNCNWSISIISCNL